MRKEYAFYLTDEQGYAIQELGLAYADVSFSTSGMVHATVFGEYDITCYTLRKDGEVVRETRDLDGLGWVVDIRSPEGKWLVDEEEAA